MKNRKYLKKNLQYKHKIIIYLQIIKEFFGHFSTQKPGGKSYLNLKQSASGLEAIDDERNVFFIFMPIYYLVKVQ